MAPRSVAVAMPIKLIQVQLGSGRGISTERRIIIGNNRA